MLASPAAPPAAIIGAPAPEVGPASDIAALAALPTPGAGSGAGASAVAAALSRVGSPYVWAAAGPAPSTAPGLVMWSFQQAGIFLPHSS